MPAPVSLDPGSLGQVLIVSPHDDDGVIGCGGLIQRLSAPPVIAIVTDGRLGYHETSQRGEIVAVRRTEARSSYAALGLGAEQIVFLDYPDMSLNAFLCWETLDGRPGIYQRLLRLLREQQVETVLLPSAADFHPDHRAAHDAARVAAAQARTGLAPDCGPPAPICALWTYQVWEPLGDAPATVALTPEQGGRKRTALQAYVSQGPVIDELVARETLSFVEERFQHLPL